MPSCFFLANKNRFKGARNLLITRKTPMTKEVVKHRKEEKKKPLLSPKEKKAKKQEKKLHKQGKI
ncbi:MAG: hypothetical protein A3E80_04725 [Chlamydiae bacterium RIFCSPHIGHO2_12_FULL_49_9]|nr:MAG: hypothetical protein A3E80_04725 [Chlamydiae bacterium RIFCSPHIGHO2_12_FULL_49_9]